MSNFIQNLEAAVSAGDTEKINGTLKSLKPNEEGLAFITRFAPEIFASATRSNNKDILLEMLKTPSSELKRVLLKYNNFAAFRWAAENGHCEIVEILLREAKALQIEKEMFQANDYGAFCWAAEGGHVAVVELLLQRIDKQYKQEMIRANKCNAFIMAAEAGHLPVIRLLLQEIDPKLRFTMIQTASFTALRKAIANGHNEVAEFLWQEIAQEFVRSINAGDLKKVESILGKLTSEEGNLLINKIPPESLMNEVSLKNNKILHAFFKAATPERRQQLICCHRYWAFKFALKSTNTPLVKFFLREANAENKREMIKVWAKNVPSFFRHTNNIEIIMEILRTVADEMPNPLFSIFGSCTEREHQQVVKFLFDVINSIQEPGRKQFIVNNYMFGEFHRIVFYGHTDSVEFFLNAADLALRNQMADYGMRVAFIPPVRIGILDMPIVPSIRVVELLLQALPPEGRIKAIKYIIDCQVESPETYHSLQTQLTPLVSAYIDYNKMPKANLAIVIPHDETYEKIQNRHLIYLELMVQNIHTGLEQIVNQKAVLKLVCRNVERMFKELEVSILSHIFLFLNIKDLESAIEVPSCVLTLRTPGAQEENKNEGRSL